METNQHSIGYSNAQRPTGQPIRGQMNPRFLSFKIVRECPSITIFFLNSTKNIWTTMFLFSSDWWSLQYPIAVPSMFHPTWERKSIMLNSSMHKSRWGLACLYQILMSTSILYSFKDIFLLKILIRQSLPEIFSNRFIFLAADSFLYEIFTP